MYSLPYILLIVLCGILALIYPRVDESTGRKIRIACALVYILFFGFRGFIGDDWLIYYPEFMNSGSNFSELGSLDDSIFEPGFALMMLVSKSIVDSFQFFVFICCVINCFLLFRFLEKRVDNFPLALLVFLCMGGFVFQINLMRNSMSILIFLNSLSFIEQKRPIPYFLCCLLGFSLHVSSLLFVPLYFILNRPCSKWVYLSVFIVGNMILLCQVHFLGPLLIYIAGQMGEVYAKMAESYIEGVYADMNKVVSIGYLERLFTGILIFCYFDKLKVLRRENVMYINAFLFYISFYFIFSEFSVMAERLSYLFVFAYWILWPDLIKCFSIQNNRILFICFLSVYSVLKVRGMTNLITLEYDNVLWGTKSYEERLYIHDKNTDDEEP